MAYCFRAVESALLLDDGSWDVVLVCQHSEVVRPTPGCGKPLGIRCRECERLEEPQEG